jgi:hypothetical protein
VSTPNIQRSSWKLSKRKLSPTKVNSVVRGTADKIVSVPGVLEIAENKIYPTPSPSQVVFPAFVPISTLSSRNPKITNLSPQEEGKLAINVALPVVGNV